MKFQIDALTRRQGRAPHELAMINLLVFNLMLCGGVVASSMAQRGSVLEHYKLWIIAVPLAVSFTIIAFSFWRTLQTRNRGPWFAAVHWEIAASRYRILLLVYLVGAGLIGLGWLLAHTQDKPGMQEMMFIALQRVAVAPMLISVMVLAVLESSSLFQAGNGEVPDGATKRMPPPADLTASPSVAQHPAD
jgi:hypothetical protein